MNWISLSKQRAFFDQLSNDIGVVDWKDWYKVSVSTVIRNDGKGLLKQYGDSLSKALLNVYPEHKWTVWDFSITPKGCFDDECIRRRYLDHLQTVLNINSWEDWYLVRASQIREHSGQALLTIYDGSVIDMVTSIYPEYNWESRKFRSSTPGFWTIPANQREFMEDLSAALNLKSWEDWYRIKYSDFIDYGGASLLKVFGNHHSKAIMTVYHEYDWKPWKFSDDVDRISSRKPKSYWRDFGNHKKFFDEYQSRMNMTDISDWYRVKVSDIVSREGGSGILGYYNYSLTKALSCVYPEHPWLFSSSSSIHKIPRKSQISLFESVQGMFNSDTEDLEVFMDFIPPDTKIELDVALPFLSLAFEYQGEQHHRNLNNFTGLEWTQKRDREKREYCKDRSIDLIEVPFTWQGDKRDLAREIVRLRPDLAERLQRFIEESQDDLSGPIYV